MPRLLKHLVQYIDLQDDNMRSHCFIILVLACAPFMAVAQTPIHQCKSADGGVMYSQFPCRDEVPAKVEEPEETEVVEEPDPMTDITEMLAPEPPEEDAATSEERAACKKRYRDEIDAIDAEIRREYSRDKDDEYKQRLLALTRNLREC